MKTNFPPQPLKSPLSRFLVLGCATGLGLGYAPKAPGTAGSLLGLVLGAALLQLPVYAALGLLLLLLAVATPLADRAAKHWGEGDCQKIVIDEVLGQALTILGVAYLFPMGDGLTFENAWGYFVLGFALFRLLDVTKPFPARTFDRLQSGWGIMMDDVVAGAYGALILRGLAKIWPHL